MTRARLRSIAALLAVPLAGAASLATSQAPPTTTVEASGPVTVQHGVSSLASVDVTVARGTSQPGYLDLHVSADYGFLISVLDGDRGALAPPDPSYGSLQLVNLRPACGSGCTKRFLVVTRQLPSMGTTSGTLTASVFGHFPEDEQPDVDVTVRSEPDAMFASAPARLTTTLSDSISVTAGARPSVWRGRLIVSADALPAGSSWQLGTFWPSGTLSGIVSEAPIALTARIGRNEAGYSLLENGHFEGFGTDWGSQCAPGGTCELPVTVELDWFVSSGESPAAGGQGTAHFTLEASIDYLDRSEVPAGATIELRAAR